MNENVDTIEKIGNSLIQHGKYNDRIYLMKFDVSDIENILPAFDDLLKKYKYSKIFIKLPSKLESIFSKRGFIREAIISNFYKFYENDDCLFMAKFLNNERKNLPAIERQKIDDVLKIANEKAKKINSLDLVLAEDYKIKIFNTDACDVKELTLLYRDIFDSYPFPVFDTDYILKTMKNNVVYFGCFFKDKLVAASSAEMDPATQSVEMTDFATAKDFRGKNLAMHLLAKMELEMKKNGMKIFYTIARSFSFGMNISFSKSGYKFGGTLINNTNISGQIESMNVWYKSI